eukprot:13408356-Ditylum_brightwellii.AAC.1
MHAAAQYTELECLKEVMFEGASTDTDDFFDERAQPNEAINNGAVTMAPNAINYATSHSLSDQIHHMIRVHNFGHCKFFEAAFLQMGSSLDIGLRKYLNAQERKKVCI